MLRASLRDLSAEDNEEDPDRKYKDEEEDEAERPPRGRGRGRGRARGRGNARGGRRGRGAAPEQQNNPENQPTSPAAEQLESLVKVKPVEEKQVEHMQHPLPSDIHQAADMSEHLVDQDVKAAKAHGTENANTHPPEEAAPGSPKKTTPRKRKRATPKKRAPKAAKKAKTPEQKHAPEQPEEKDASDKKKESKSDNAPMEDAAMAVEPAAEKAGQDMSTPKKRKSNSGDERPATPKTPGSCKGTPKKRAMKNQEPIQMTFSQHGCYDVESMIYDTHANDSTECMHVSTQDMFLNMLFV